jgi:hypothetical protein
LLNHVKKRLLFKAGGLLPEETSDDEEELTIPIKRTSLLYKEVRKRKREKRRRGTTSEYHQSIAKAIQCSAMKVRGAYLAQGLPRPDPRALHHGPTLV